MGDNCHDASATFYAASFMPVPGGNPLVPSLTPRVRALGLGVGVALCVGIVLGPVPTTVSAAAPVAGFGHAAGQSFQIDPRTAGLSYQVTFGSAIADHQNSVARAQAQVANFGLIGSALSAPGCNDAPPPISPDTLPKSVRVDSRDPGAAKGKSEVNGPFEQTARASERPFADAYTKIAPLDLGGVVSFLGGKAESTSGLDDNDKPQSVAEVNIAGISFVGGVVKLEGLHWRSASRPDVKDPTTLFSIDAVKIAGTDAPTADPFAAIDIANLVLVPLGIQIAVPKIHTENNTTFVDPLRVGIVPSKQRDAVVGQLFSAIQPIRQAVFQYLLDNTPCEYSPASAILVADIITLSVTGGGSMAFNVGGTQAQTRKLEPIKSPFGDAPTLTPSVVDAGSTDSGSFPIVDGGTGAGDLPPITEFDNGTSNGNGATRRALPASTSGGDDNAMWVAIAVIGLGAVLVEGELRMRRRTQRAGGAA